MSKQFCPRCGKATLTRVSCTTTDKGEVKLHLKANMQWNNRGNVFSIPKPTSGSANQKWKGPRQGGGQSGWGNDLILAEDQKEYIRAMSSMKRTKEKDLMDQDTLPSILTGDRGQNSGKTRIGAGRNINSRKR
jgi:RNA-binding protein NOB1